jgi:hypothetical protein
METPVILALLAASVSVGVAAGNIFFGWRNQRDVENVKRKLQSELEREKFTFSLQFNEEFNLYRQLWEKLEALKDSAILLDKTPGTESIIYPEGVNQIERQKEIDNELSRNIGVVLKFIHSNRPFFHEDVFQPIQVLISSCSKRWYRNTRAVPDDMSVDEFWKQVRTHVDEIAEAIRRRIGLAKNQEILKGL